MDLESVMKRIPRDEIFDENGALSAAYLLARGHCCGNGCRNCPYEPRHGGAGAQPRQDPNEMLERSEARHAPL